MAEEEEEDIISTLPDPILCHILSSLETKQSVATSALSKRWKNLHLSVPTLRFNGQVTDHLTNFQFNDFVYSVLLPRDAAFPVKTFHFDVTYDDDPIQCPIDSITKWVNFVVQRKLEYLHLSVGSMGLPKLPTTILTCKTLVVLKLFYFSVEEGYSSVVLPSLKTLHLEYIWFPQLRDFMIFLTGCPNLEDLVTYDVSFDSDESLTCNEWNSFCLTNLISADIDCYHYCFPFKAVHNVLSLSFEIDQVHYRNDLIPNFQNLTQLELISLDYSWRFLIEVLNHCPKLQKLDLDQADLHGETWTKKDDKENWIDPDVVPQCLSLHLRSCDLFNFLGLQGELLFARYILKNARVLQTMTIRNVGQTQIKRLISSCPKASRACKVTIYQRLNVHYRNDLIPNFCNLTQLELISLDYSWQFLIEVLNHCPKLQKLDLDQADLDKESWTKKDDKENWVDPVVVPQCLSLHLRTCDLFNFLGLQSEILFTKYILKNARVLQTMTIGNVGQTQIKRLISSCPKASAACKITIYRQRLNKTG